MRGRVAYVPSVRAEASRVARHLFGGEPYLAVQVRRGTDYPVGFCYNNEVQRATKRRTLWGWNMSMPMCYPQVEEVSATILAALARRHLRHVYLATDSPRSTVILGVLAAAELAACAARGALYAHMAPPWASGQGYGRLSIAVQLWSLSEAVRR